MKSFKFNYRKTGIILFSILICYLLLAVVLVHLPEPEFEAIREIPQEELESLGINNEQKFEYQEQYISMRDGIKIYTNQFDVASNTTIILIHGILGSNEQFNTTAGQISTETNTNVIAIDLRGHGKSEGASGDINYIDQYVDDIIDLVDHVHQTRPNQRVILAGHSMGGGIIMRYVAKADNKAVDGYLLFAPALGWESPTTKKDKTEADEQFAQVHIPRFIGLAMLNSFHLSFFNDKPVLYFNLPEDQRIKEYSYRSVVSMSPDDVYQAFQKVDQPLLVIVGRNDQMFYADQYAPLVSDNSEGETYIIENTDHNSVHYHTDAIDLIEQWLIKNTLVASK